MITEQAGLEGVTKMAPVILVCLLRQLKACYMGRLPREESCLEACS